MTFKKYNHTNNAFAELATPITDSDTTMILAGNYNRFPTSNFIVKISKYQGTQCIARENIYIANRVDNVCSGLIRAYEEVPMDDNATENIQQALNFSAGDMVEVVISSEFLKDIQTEIETKLGKQELRNNLSNNGFIIIENGEEKIVSDLPENITTAILSKVQNTTSGVVRENITGNLTPVIVHKNTTIKQEILPEMDSNSIVVGGETITVSNKNATKRNNIRIIGLDSSSRNWTVNMGKKRKIVGIEIRAELNNSSDLKIEYGNDGSQWALAKIIDYTSLSTSDINLFVHISLDFEAQYIKLSGTRDYVDLRYCQIFEEVIYDGIYKVNPHIPGLARTDGFVFKNLNKNDTTTVALLGQNSNVSGFSSVANSPVFVDDDGRITTTPSIRGLGIVRDGILSVDTIQHFGAIGTLLEFGHDSDNTKQNTIITSGNIAINEGRYMWKISDNINYSLSSFYGNYELQYSVDGNTWVAIKSIPFQSNSRRNNEEHTFTIPSGLVRVCIHEKDQSNYTYNIKTSLTTHLG